MLVYEPVDDVRSPKSLWAPRPSAIRWNHLLPGLACISLSDFTVF